MDKQTAKSLFLGVYGVRRVTYVEPVQEDTGRWSGKVWLSDGSSWGDPEFTVSNIQVEKSGKDYIEFSIGDLRNGSMGRWQYNTVSGVLQLVVA